MKRFKLNSISWRTVLGVVTLVALAATLFSLIVYGTHAQTSRVAGTGTSLLLIAYLLSGGLRQLQFFRSRQFLRGSASTIYALAVIGILVLVNVLAGQTAMRWDVTEAREHSLSDQTDTILQNLEQEVEILAFFPDDSAIKGEVSGLLREYEYRSPLVDVRFIDPEVNPGKASEHEVTDAYTTVVKSGERTHHISIRNLYDFSAIEQGGDPADVQFQGEQALTRAIAQIAGDVDIKTYFVKGHGQPGLYDKYSQLRNYMDGEGYQPGRWDPARDGPLPEDADLIILAGPTSDLRSEEVEQLKNYVDEGGPLLILADTVPGENHKFENLNDLVRHVGIQMRPDYVQDPVRSYYMDPETPVAHIEHHTITDKLVRDEMVVALPQTRSLTVRDDAPEDYDISRLLFASDQASSVVDPDDEHDDIPEVDGRLGLGYAVARLTEGTGNGESEDDEPDKQPIAVVIGDSDFVGNEMIGFQGNSDLFLNSVQWLLDREDLITIRPREPVPRQVFVTASEARLLFYGSTLILPFIVLAVGGTIWLRRRHL